MLGLLEWKVSVQFSGTVLPSGAPAENSTCSPLTESASVGEMDAKLREYQMVTIP